MINRRVQLRAFALTVSCIQHANAFSFYPTPSTRCSILHMSAVNEYKPTRSGRSKEEIGIELSNGRVLENGPVVDFGSVKDVTSRAERALAQARVDSLSAIKTHGQDATKIFNPNSRLMGINDEVVETVGREVGISVAADVVQRCAVYLRSQAPAGMFEVNPDDGTMHSRAHAHAHSKNIVDTASLRSEVDSTLAQCYEESGVVTEAFAKTFYLGTQLMSESSREAIWAVYVWCRRTDEIVDAPRTPDDIDMLTDLSVWEIRLENLFRFGTVEDMLDLALLDTIIKCPDLSIQPFSDMVRGMLMDIPDLGQDRYETFDELHLYAYRVAGTVGLMSMPIFGCAEGFGVEDAKEPALSLGVAFQLTNILRDVGEDAVERGRIYLPREDMAEFGITDEQIFNQKLDENYINFMKAQIARTRMYYERAKRGIAMLSPESRFAVQSSLDCYGEILNKIEENGYDNLTQRAYVSRWEKLSMLPFSWYRTQDIAKMIPLPGES